MEMRKLSLVIFLLALAGCASDQAISRNYSKLVNASDGVSEQEAKILAQKQLVDTMQKRDYRVTAPDVKTTPAALKYPAYWFVVFGHNWLSPISTDPLAKTYTELRETQYLVVIDKQSGEVKFAGEWYPKRSDNFDWVFDPNSYKKDNPLGLPPGVKGQPLY